MIFITKITQMIFITKITQSLQDGSVQSQGLGLRVILCLQRRGGASPRYVEGRRAAFVLGFPPPPPKLAPFMGLGFLENPRAHGIFLGSRWVNFMMAWGLI